MKRMREWQLIALLGFYLHGLCGAGYGAVANHVNWISISQGQAYDGIGVAGPGYYFALRVHTDDTVNHIEFATPGGRACVIGNDSQSSSGDVQTYHRVSGSLYAWEYSAWSVDIAGLSDYGDGTYQLTVHYNDTSTDVTTVSYTVPGTGNPISQPTQKPNITSPSLGASLSSPVTLIWDACTDPNATSICVEMYDSDDVDTDGMRLSIGATSSDPCGVGEGIRAAQVVFEARHELTNTHGIACEVAKGSAALSEFEVIYQEVHRFVLNGTTARVWTVRESEKSKLLQYYPTIWIYEGHVFYAWANDYDADLEPVFRFWNQINNDHFYTASVSERDKLINLYPHIYVYEGIGYYAYQATARPPETVPLYRMWHNVDNTHYYTTDAAERTLLLTPPTSWIDKGITCYVQPLP